MHKIYSKYVCELGDSYCVVYPVQGRGRERERKKNVKYGNFAGFVGYNRKQACDIQNLINERQI